MHMTPCGVTADTSLMCALVYMFVCCVYAGTCGTCVCLPIPVWCVCMRTFLSVLESSAGVGDGDNGRAQSEQGGQKMGNESGQRTQEHHTL